MIDMIDFEVYPLFDLIYNLLLSGRQIDIVTLAGRVCKKHGISLGELCSGSRRREIVEARGIVSWIAVRDLGYSGADVARYLGVTNSCITRSISSGESPKVKDYIKPGIKTG